MTPARVAAAMEKRVEYRNFISIKRKKRTALSLFMRGQFLFAGSCPGPRSSFVHGVVPRTPEQFMMSCPGHSYGEAMKITEGHVSTAAP